VETKDQEHLRLLSIFHYVVGGIGTVFGLFPLIHVTMGILFLCSPHILQGDSGAPAPELVGYMFAVIGGCFFVFLEGLAVSVIYSGVQIKKRRKYLFSFVVACIMCVFVPFGTILGVFTIIVLSRESVRKLYEDASQARSA